MKKRVLWLCTLTALMFAATGCGNTDTPPEDYPIEISFTEYPVINDPLSENPCRWNLPGYQNGFYSALIIINSNEELECYIECTGANYPAVDFSRYTLLLAHGVEGHLVRPAHTSLQQLSAESYIMKVGLNPFLVGVITPWQVPIIVSKIADGSVVELIVTK